MFEKLMRTDEVGVVLDIPTDRVARMARQGQLPAIRCGRTWRFAREALDAWMSSGGAGGWKRVTPTETLNTGGWNADERQRAY